MSYEEYQTKPFEDIKMADDLLAQVERTMHKLPKRDIGDDLRVAYAAARAQLALAKMTGRMRV